MNRDNIKKIIEKNNGIITAKEADKYGIDSWYLTDMVRKGSLRDYVNIFGISERIESILEVLVYEV